MTPDVRSPAPRVRCGLRRIARSGLAATLLVAAGLREASAHTKPNFVIIVADDLGYGDLGCYGNTQARTPAIDRIASDGVRLTEFYTPAPTCSPARASLLTGRHPLRTGITRVFVPKEVQGLPAAELTLAEHLRGAGYATACIGKWHLGGRAKYRPQRHGFDEFFGVLYSNNMVWIERWQWPRIELFDGDRSIESPATGSFLTRRYTERAVKFAEKNADRPFLLYLAFTMPHLPLAVSPEFDGRSGNGLYADVIEEIDASVGYLMRRLESLGIGDRTFVFLTSDNGPWTGGPSMAGGSAGGLRGIKGTTWEGGVRIPLVAKGPGLARNGAVLEGPASLLDLFPTVGALAGVPPPDGLELDGADIGDFLRGTRAVPRRTLVFSNRNRVNAVREGPWKLHLRERPVDKRGVPQGSVRFDPPLLYRLSDDPSETADVAAQHPQVVDRMRRAAASFEEAVDPQLRLRPFGRAILRGLLTPAP